MNGGKLKIFSFHGTYTIGNITVDGSRDMQRYPQRATLLSLSRDRGMEGVLEISLFI